MARRENVWLTLTTSHTDAESLMVACVTRGGRPVGQTIAFSCVVRAQNDFQSAGFPSGLEAGGWTGAAGCGRRWPWENRASANRGGLPRDTNDEFGGRGSDSQRLGEGGCVQRRFATRDATRIGTDSCRRRMQMQTQISRLADGNGLQVWSAGENAYCLLTRRTRLVSRSRVVVWRVCERECVNIQD